MPAEELAAFSDALDDVGYLFSRLLDPADGTRRQNAAARRQCVVLCQTAWEVYAKDSIEWVAGRAAATVADEAQLPPRLRRVVASAPDKLAPVAEQGGYIDEPGDLAELGEAAWQHVLHLELRRRTRGVVTGGRRRGAVSAATFASVADQQTGVFGAPLIEDVRIPGQSDDYVQRWVDLLVEVRHGIVHRARTRGLLDTAGVREWIPRVHNIGTAMDRRIEAWADEHLPPR